MRSHGWSVSAGRAFLVLASLPLYVSAQVDIFNTPVSVAQPPTTTQDPTSTTVFVPIFNTPVEQPTTETSIAVEETTTTSLIPDVPETVDPVNTPGSETTTTEVLIQDTTTTELPIDTTTTALLVDTTTTELPLGTPTTELPVPVDTTTTELPVDTTTTELPVAADTTTDLPLGTPTTTDLPVDVTTTTEQLPETTTTTPGFPEDTTTTAVQPIDTTTTTALPIEPPTTTTELAAETTTTVEQAADTTTTAGDPAATITDAPVLTTATGAAATSSVSSVSTEILGLIPIINSWKDNVDALKDETKNKVDEVKDHVLAVIKDLGGDSTKGCDNKRKRGLLGFIGDIVNSLVCIAQDLTDISSNIVIGDVTAVTSVISGVQSTTEELTDEENNDQSDQNSEQESTEQQSSTEEPTSTTTSPCTDDTAEHVTIVCKPTTITEDGNVRSTETCFESITIEVTGCSVTEATTVISTTGTAPAITPCAPDTCGGVDACPLGELPLSGAAMNYVSSQADCAALSTITTSELPTGYGTLNDISVAEPTARPESDSPAVKRGFSDAEKRELSARTFAHNTTPNPFYVASLSPVWVSQLGDASGHWFDFPQTGQGFAGVNGIYGCTAVIIASERGVYLSHIWENPVFIDIDWNPTDDASFNANAFEALRDGTAYAQSITALVGDDANPGVLNAIYSPKVFVLTPFTGPNDPTGVTTRFRYQDRAQQLADNLASVIPGSGGSGYLLGYTRTNQKLSTEDIGTWGRAIFEVDVLQSVLMTPFAPEGSLGLRIGRWRLWVEDQLITYQDFWIPDVTPAGNQKRQDSDADACLVVGNSDGSTTEATSTATGLTTTDIQTTDTTGTPVETTTAEPTTVEPTTETTETIETTTDSTKVPTTFETSTIFTTPAPDTTTDQETTTTEAAFTGPVYCVNFGGPRVATPYCQCSTTTAGQTFFATAPLISGHCTDYTNFPSAVTVEPTEVVTAAPTTTQAAIPVTPLTRQAIVCHNEADFPGHADINGGSQDDYSTDFSGLSGPNGDDNLYDGAGIIELSKSDKHGVSYYYSVNWIDGCVTTQDTQNFRFPLGMGGIITAYLMVREDYTKCTNGGVGGSVQVGCLLYTFTGGK
ncbi:hypothetical protein BGZ61DRAFT_392794 [Ilyonectria robusta]|uniref:uncharacterized protein n=1 Tax=Ilyonectria robusta TaxID=1079257 RepID=UPI001E8DC262|nr:uncharacterized protein BGZ61DRAFT_392794 [Ilyonectria robusta]KAH8686198.1 hypothetical protein BGZ61DRAFT_392794 [Ilyonectria robusta]